MSYEFHKEEYRGYTIRIEQDECAESPRDGSNLGRIVFWPGRGWNTGDEHLRVSKEDWLLGLATPFFQSVARLRGVSPDLVDPTHEESLSELGFEWISALAAAIEWIDKNFAILVVNQDRHSGELSYSAMCQWEDSDDGFIYAERAAIAEWFKYDTWEAGREMALQHLRGEVDVYSSYLVGNVAYYEIENAEGETIECVGGYYAEDGEWDYAIREAKASIDRLLKDHEAKA